MIMCVKPENTNVTEFQDISSLSSLLSLFCFLGYSCYWLLLVSYSPM